MTRKTKLTDEQSVLKSRVLDVYTKPFGFYYHDPNWHKNLWGRKTHEIYEYLENVLNTAMNEVEYYAAMVYLVNVVPDSDLYTEFGSLPRIVECRGYDHTNQKETLNRKQQNSVNHNETGIKTIQVLGSETIIGGV